MNLRVSESLGPKTEAMAIRTVDNWWALGTLEAILLVNSHVVLDA